MAKQTTNGTTASRLTWETLDAFARAGIQTLLQRVLEAEVTERRGREKSARRAAVAPQAGSRNGSGKPRRLSRLAGTVTLRRPSVSGREARFERRILPLFTRRTEQGGPLRPELSRHGLAQGDVALALRGLLGEGAPRSARAIARLKAGWPAEYEAWRSRPLEALAAGSVWADGGSTCKPAWRRRTPPCWSCSRA